jgi:hypothetical protein
MMVKPKVFWNYAFPYFAAKPLKSKATCSCFASKIETILVQYPQHLIGMQDFIDNKNAAFYTLDQTLRDCANCVTSSGSQAIWDYSNPEYEFNTKSRVEDTATTQQYLADYLSVHVLCFVANGVPKREQDYIDSLYRWTTGAIELFYPSVYNQFKHYQMVFIFALIYASAWGFFGWLFPPIWGYILWILFNLIIGFNGIVDILNHRKPFRHLNVSFTIVTNTMYWLSNLMSPVWTLIVPGSIGKLIV